MFIDGVHNDSAPLALTEDRRVYCRLELSNQPPFILWDSPEDEAELASGSELMFNASRSWDLDLDELNYSWTSSIDGSLLDGCSGGDGAASNNSVFHVNGDAADSCSLSDGEHSIT